MCFMCLNVLHVLHVLHGRIVGLLGLVHPILIKFGLGANIGLKITLNEFEMTMAIFLTDWTIKSKLTYSKSF